VEAWWSIGGDLVEHCGGAVELRQTTRGKAEWGR
jgi:hypothetical protein